MHYRPNWLLLAGFAFVAACGGGGGSPTQTITGPHVVISDFTFSPNTLTITAGQTVTWTNSGPSVHNVTSDTMGMFQSSNLAAPTNEGAYGTPGGTFTFTFNTPGTYPYHDALYPPSMAQYSSFTGTIVVNQ